MSTLAPPPPQARPAPGPVRLSSAPSAGATTPPRDPRERGGTVLFEVAFSSVMGDRDLAVLARLLDISTHAQAKMRPDPTAPGVARLDDFSALFLEREPEPDRWVLRARTWGRPAPQAVHRWQIVAALAAHRLDPRVRMPAPRAGQEPRR